MQGSLSAKAAEAGEAYAQAEPAEAEAAEADLLGLIPAVGGYRSPVSAHVVPLSTPPGSLSTDASLLTPTQPAPSCSVPLTPGQVMHIYIIRIVQPIKFRIVTYVTSNLMHSSKK